MSIRCKCWRWEILTPDRFYKGRRRAHNSPGIWPRSRYPATKPLANCEVRSHTKALTGSSDSSIVAWRPLRGPLNDWPLGLCDADPINFTRDTMPADIVYPHRATENLQIIYNKSQRWFHLPEQTESEILIFKSATSREFKVASKLLVGIPSDCG